MPRNHDNADEHFNHYRNGDDIDNHDDHVNNELDDTDLANNEHRVDLYVQYDGADHYLGRFNVRRFDDNTWGDTARSESAGAGCGTTAEGDDVEGYARRKG